MSCIDDVSGCIAVYKTKDKVPNASADHNLSSGSFKQHCSPVVQSTKYDSHIINKSHKKTKILPECFLLTSTLCISFIYWIILITILIPFCYTVPLLIKNNEIEKKLKRSTLLDRVIFFFITMVILNQFQIVYLVIRKTAQEI